MNSFLEKLTNNVDIERYKVSRIDDIDYDQQRWKIEYDDTTDKK